jgi:transcriptional regulator GlxA family with amidase domain
MSTPRAYGIVIYDGVEPIDIGATYGVLSMARRRAPSLNYVGVAREAGPVTCANGLIVHADVSFDDCPDVADLVVTGGPGWTDAANDPQMLAFLTRMASRPDIRISSICTGAMILAAAGLLDGKSATTKAEVFAGETPPLDQLAARGTTTVERVRLVESGGIVTGGGVSLGIDTVFRLLERSHGADVAADVARVMEYDRALAANDTARLKR